VVLTAVEVEELKELELTAVEVEELKELEEAEVLATAGAAMEAGLDLAAHRTDLPTPAGTHRASTSCFPVQLLL
jgi:hypothetical protein